MSEMIERVALAICLAARDGIPDPNWPNERIRGHWVKLARAAIEAMREPTKAMIEDGVEADIPGHRIGTPTFRDSNVDEDDVPVIWRVMIDAALKQAA